MEGQQHADVLLPLQMPCISMWTLHLLTHLPSPLHTNTFSTTQTCMLSLSLSLAHSLSKFRPSTHEDENTEKIIINKNQTFSSLPFSSPLHSLHLLSSLIPLTLLPSLPPPSLSLSLSHTHTHTNWRPNIFSLQV